MKTKFSNENWWACCLDATPHFVFAGEKTVCTMLHNDIGDENYEPMEAIVTHDECVANTKLIAAAPEMFEALSAMIRIKDIYMPSDINEVRPEHYDEMTVLFKAFGQMEEVIKKATE